MATNKKFVAKNGLIAPDAEFTGVTSITLPAGTTAERPQNPVSGMVRFNTDVGALESYDGVEWVEVGGDVDTEGFATATQGILAITALQPGDNVSELVNDTGFLTDEDAVDLRDRTTHTGTQAATTVDYDNSNTQLNSTNVQTAIDELANKGFLFELPNGQAWGNNGQGRLGDGTATGRSSPVAILFSGKWKQISASARHTAAITDDGIAYAWGRNNLGQLGDGTTTYRSSPVTVIGGITNWKQISAGTHTAAVTEDGVAYAWGNNTAGRLGDGTTTYRMSPVTVIGGITNWKSISAGYSHTAAVTDDGIAYAWGDNFHGRLGDNTTDERSSPVTVVGGITNWKSVECAYGPFSVGITESGIAYAWGYNDKGQLGDGTATGRSSPVTVVGGITNWKQTASAYSHTAAVTEDGIAYAWGSAGAGRLGNGETSYIGFSSPVTVMGGITNWKQVAASSYCSVAGITDNGIAYGWGCNYNGQLGDGTTTDRISPVTVVGGFTTWSQITGGYGVKGLIGSETAVFGK